MEDYKEMYYALFNVFSEVIENIEEANYGTAKALLIKAQQKAEELFINTADDSPEQE